MGEESLKEFLQKKTNSKQELCKKLSFEHGTPLIGLVIDNEVEDSHRSAVERFLEGTCSLEVEVVVVADTDLDSFSHPNVHYVPYSEKSRKNIMEASDIMVALPSNDMEEMLMNGVIPISHKHELINNYNPNSETGNGFVYGNANEVDHWKMFAALIRALETYKFPYDWRNIISTGLTSTHK